MAEIFGLVIFLKAKKADTVHTYSTSVVVKKESVLLLVMLPFPKFPLFIFQTFTLHFFFVFIFFFDGFLQLRNCIHHQSLDNQIIGGPVGLLVMPSYQAPYGLSNHEKHHCTHLIKRSVVVVVEVEK